MTQIFLLHSPYGLMTTVAAIDAGILPENGERILVPVNQAKVPETHLALHESPALRSLLGRFDRVEPLEDLVTPMHPTAWKPHLAERTMLERLFSRAWGVGRDVELFVQSPQVAPARTLMEIFSHARLGVIGDGLMTYSPIRSKLARTVTDRIGSVIYADVVPGVEPLVFQEAGAARVPVPAEAFRKVMEETAPAPKARTAKKRTALVLGQYLAALGLVSAKEETAMQVRMVDRALAWDAEHIVFKPHPSAPATVIDAVQAQAAVRGVSFEVHRGDEPAEVLAARLGAVGVVAGFSTALPTVKALYDIPIAAIGNATVLARLDPYANSNRVPATIVDALTRDGAPYGADGALQHLVDAVGYCMQPRIMASLRARAETLLATLPGAERSRYFNARTLWQLDLPGGAEPSRIEKALHSTGGIGRAEVIRLTIAGARRRVGRAWKVVRGR